MWFNSLALISIVLIFSSAVFADEIACINGPYSQNTAFIDSIEASKDPLKKAYLNSRSNFQKNTGTTKEFCPETDLNKKHFGFFSKLADNIRQQFSTTVETQVKTSDSPIREPATKINKECIAAAMMRKSGNNGYTCRHPTAQEVKRGFNPNTQSVAKSYGTAGGDNTQCVTDNTVDYISFAVNSAIQCMSPADPIDSRVIFKKLNNETGFNPSIAWNGGAGLGQMTSIAASELSSSTVGKGRYILEEIANSEKPECSGFKNIAKNDLKSRPPINELNFCSWVSPGDGLARNLIYSIGYYLTMRDQYIIPTVEKRSQALLKQRELISDLTAISYGAEGLEHAKWLLQKYRVNEKTSATKFQSQIRQNSKYLENIEEKMQEMTCLKKGLNPSGEECKRMKLSKNELEANTCVSK